MKMKFVSDKKWTIAFTLLILTGLFIVFGRFIFGDYAFVFDGLASDSITLFYPELLQTMHEYSDPGLSTWSFSQGLGDNSFGRTFLYPLTWPLAFMSPQQIALYIIYMQLVKILIAGFVFYKYLMMLNLNQKAVVIGTLLYTFQGWLIVSSPWYGHASSYIQFAFLLFSFELILKRGIWWPFSIAIWYAFSSKIFFFTEFMVLYSLIRMADLNGFNWPFIRKNAILVGKGIALGIVLYAPFLGSFIYNFVYSPRVAGDFSYASSLSSTSLTFLESALHYWSIILRTFSPNILGTESNYTGFYNYLEGPCFYIGLITLLLAPQVFHLLNKVQKWTYGSVLIFWFLLLLFPYFRYAFYAFAGDYFKSAVNIFLPFTLLYFSLRSMDSFFQSGRINKLTLLLSLAAALFLLFVPKSIDAAIDMKLVLISSLLLAGYSLVLIISSKFHNKSWVFYLLFLSIYLESVYVGSQSTNNFQAVEKSKFKERVNYNDYSLEAIQFLKSQSNPFFRIEKTYGSVLSGYNDALAQNYFSSKTYNSHNHNNYVSFLREIDMLESNEEIYSRWLLGVVSAYYLHPLMNVKYILSTPQTEVYVWKSIYKNIGYMNGLMLFENQAYLPMGTPFESYYYTNEFRSLSTKERKHMMLYAGVVISDEDQNSFPQLRHGALSEIENTGSIQYVASNLREKSMVMEKFEQNRIIGNIELNRPAMVHFAFPFDAGWKAYVDGRRQNLNKINFGMTGLLVDSGKHHIELKYKPPFFTIGWILFFCGFVFLLYIIRSDHQKHGSQVNQHP